MPPPRVTWSRDVRAADWLVQRLRTGQPVVGAVIPCGFEAYARLLHPADLAGSAVRWAELAACARVALQPGVAFEALQRRTGWQGEAPIQGSLPAQQARALIGVLSEFTAAPHRCWFGVWDGYGWLYPERSVRRLTQQGHSAPPPAANWSAVATAPRAHAPNRDYLLYTGPLELATALAAPPWQQTPNLWWPDEHTWCVASDIDLASTYVGGTQVLIDGLLADPRFEAIAVQPTDPLVASADG